ncbi:MAG: phage portal protein [Sphaerochaeta sp.]|nr:phage portal protein [Sphaerochaeta sp.]
MGIGDIFRRIKDSISVGSTSFNWSDLSSFTADKSLENSAFWVCLMNLGRTFGSLPIHTYERLPDGSRKVVRTIPQARLLKRPCPYMDAYSFYFTLSFNYEMHGVAYAKIGRSVTGHPIALYPIASTLVLPQVKEGKLCYLYSSTGELIDRKDMLVLMNVTTNGIFPLSPLQYAKKDLATAESAKLIQSNYFRRGTMLGGIVKVPKNTTKEQKDEVKAAFISGFSGSENAYKVAVLNDNYEYTPIAINSRQAEFLEAQKWTVTEVARRFGVPEAFAGGSVRETYANSEQRGIDLVQYAILPRAVSWQNGLDTALFPNDDNYYIKLNLNGLMRGDANTRSAFYHNALLDGWMSANDVRGLEDMDPIADGDLYMVPMNYVPRSIAARYNPYDYSPMTAQVQGLPYRPMREERHFEDDRSYMAERAAVSVAQRKAIERLVRKQLKQEIDALKKAVEDGASPSEIIQLFANASRDIAMKFGDQYVEVFGALAKKIQPIVHRQVKTGSEIDQDSLEKFVKGYGYGAADRHAMARQNAAEKVLKATPDDQVKDTVDTMTQDWLANIPASEAAEESNRSSNAVTVWLYGALGVTYMHVVANAGACEFCQKIDGRVVEVNGTILSKGEDVDDGEGNILHINKSMKHPPFHRGCECSVAPGRGR